MWIFKYTGGKALYYKDCEERERGMIDVKHMLTDVEYPIPSRVIGWKLCNFLRKDVYEENEDYFLTSFLTNKKFRDAVINYIDGRNITLVPIKLSDLIQREKDKNSWTNNWITQLAGRIHPVSTAKEAAERVRIINRVGKKLSECLVSASLHGVRTGRANREINENTWVKSSDIMWVDEAHIVTKKVTELCKKYSKCTGCPLLKRNGFCLFNKSPSRWDDYEKGLLDQFLNKECPTETKVNGFTLVVKFIDGSIKEYKGVRKFTYINGVLNLTRERDGIVFEKNSISSFFNKEE